MGYNSKPSIVRTVGDLTGVLMTLFKSHVLMIIGKPSFSDEEACMEDFDPMKGMDPQKMLIMVNPMLSSFFDVAKITDAKGNFTTGVLSLNQLGLIMRRKEYAEDFIRWAAIYSLFERVLATNAEKDPLTALKWPMTERVMNEGTGHIWKRYNLPIYITENGQSCNDRIFLDGAVHDSDRIGFLARYLGELKKCAETDDIRGYFHWSLTDTFE